MSRRTASEDEKILFRQTVEQSRPRALAKSGAKASAKKPAAKDKPGGAARNPAKGRGITQPKRAGPTPQARLDLHGYTEDAAHAALLHFLRAAQKSGLRLTLVITGKGNPKQADHAAWSLGAYGVLKQMVPRWLKEKDFSGLVADTQTAHHRHGGGGALYVHLRKTR